MKIENILYSIIHHPIIDNSIEDLQKVNPDLAYIIDNKLAQLLKITNSICALSISIIKHTISYIVKNEYKNRS